MGLSSILIVESQQVLSKMGKSGKGSVREMNIYIYMNIYKEI